MIASVAYALIVTGVYVGSLAPGASVEVRLRADNIATISSCKDLGDRFRGALVRFGAANVTVDCVPKR